MTFDMKPTADSKKGMFDGKTILDLQHMRGLVQSKMRKLELQGKSVPHTLKSELAQISFAIRAKSGWGKINEDAEMRSQVARLHSLLNKAGYDDKAIAGGIRLSDAGKEKIAARFGIAPKDVETIMATLVSHIRDENEDHPLPESVVSFNTDHKTLVRLAKQWWNGNEEQQAKAQEFLTKMGWDIFEDDDNIVLDGRDHHGDDAYIELPMDGKELTEDRYVFEPDALGNVAIHDTKTGKQAYARGSDVKVLPPEAREGDEVDEGWKSAAVAGAMMGAMAMGAGHAKAQDMGHNGANINAPSHTIQADGSSFPTNAPVGTKYGSFKDANGRVINKYVDHDLTTRFKPADEGDWKPQPFPAHAPVGTLYGSFVNKDGVKMNKYVGYDMTPVFKPASEGPWKPNRANVAEGEMSDTRTGIKKTGDVVTDNHDKAYKMLKDTAPKLYDYIRNQSPVPIDPIQTYQLLSQMRGNQDRALEYIKSAVKRDTLNVYDKDYPVREASSAEPIRLTMPDNTATKEWIEKVYAKYPATWDNNHVMSWGTGEDQQIAMFELTPSLSKRGAVDIKWFQAYPLRQGVGSKAMAELQKLAHEDGISLTLYPWDKGRVSRSSLIKFYKKMGFKPLNKGSVNMGWEPVKEGLADDAEHQEALDKTGFWGKTGAGCIVFAKDTGRFLLNHRSRSVEQPGTWGTWGGAIDAKENPAQAVVRELGEEAGYHGSVDKVVPLHVYRNGDFAYFNFLVVVESEFTPRTNWESQGFEWCEIGQWPSPLHFGLKDLLTDRPSLATMQSYVDQFAPLDESAEDFDDGMDLKGGTYNFPWKLVDKRGFATASFKGRGSSMKIEVISVTDMNGDEIKLNDHDMERIQRQAKDFIGRE